MTNRVMLDIETLSTDNSNAIVLSVGAVPWVMHKQGVIFLESYLWVLSLRDQFARGRTTMDSTIKWWRDQSDAARRHWARPDGPPVRVEVFAQEFKQLFSPETEAWANGIVFDLGNLSSLLGAAPWVYNAASDARTIYKFTEKFRTRPTQVNTGAAHDPIADCKNQIWGVWEHWQEGDLPNAGSGGSCSIQESNPSDIS